LVLPWILSTLVVFSPSPWLLHLQLRSDSSGEVWCSISWTPLDLQESHEKLMLLPPQGFGSVISWVCLTRSVLQLEYSLLYCISDPVIANVYVLCACMELWVSWPLLLAAWLSQAKRCWPLLFVP